MIVVVMISSVFIGVVSFFDAGDRRRGPLCGGRNLSVSVSLSVARARKPAVLEPMMMPAVWWWVQSLLRHEAPSRKPWCRACEAWCFASVVLPGYAAFFTRAGFCGAR